MKHLVVWSLRSCLVLFLLLALPMKGRAQAVAPPPAPVADTLAVTIGSGAVAPTSRLRLPLIVAAGPPCGGLQGEVAWDPAALHFKGVFAPRSGLVVGLVDSAAGHLPLLWTDPTGQPLPPPATLVELEFEAFATSSGLTTVALVDGPRTALLALDATLAVFPLRLTPGTVSIGPLSLTTTKAASHPTLWPNPARTIAHLTGAPAAPVVLLDNLGRVVRASQLDAAGAGSLDLRSLSAGGYAARIGAVVRRLVVE